MNRFILLTTLALCTPAYAWPNSGATLTLTVPAGQTLASVSPDPLKHPLWALCSGPAGNVQRTKQADGSTLWTVRCR